MKYIYFEEISFEFNDPLEKEKWEISNLPFTIVNENILLFEPYDPLFAQKIHLKSPPMNSKGGFGVSVSENRTNIGFGFRIVTQYWVEIDEYEYYKNAHLWGDNNKMVENIEFVINKLKYKVRDHKINQIIT